MKLRDQVATGQRIANPSDDPAAFTRVLQLQGEKQQIQQFAKNNNRAHDISQSMFSAIEQFKNLSDRAGELAVLGSGVTITQGWAYAAEVEQMIEQAVQFGNTRYSGEHLFGGTKSDVPPFPATLRERSPPSPIPVRRRERSFGSPRGPMFLRSRVDRRIRSWRIS